MHKRRQRGAWLVTFGVMAGLVAATACGQVVPNSPQSAATAVVGAQATVAAQATTFAIPQPTLQAVGATAQALGSRIGSALAQIQPQDVARLIGTTMGATMEITTSPLGVVTSWKMRSPERRASIAGTAGGPPGRLLALTIPPSTNGTRPRIAT